MPSPKDEVTPVRPVEYGTIDRGDGNTTPTTSLLDPNGQSQGLSTTSSSTAHRIEHLGKHRKYWRDIILGVNDGIISTFLLVAGVAGSGLSSSDIFLTAVAGSLAGAVSMAAGEFIATKSQNEVFQGEVGLERTHIRDFKQEEMEEIMHHLEVIGIPSNKVELREQLIAHYDGDPNALLKLMIALEFGILEDETRLPLAAALFSGFLFFAGSLPSLLPFMPKDQTPSSGLFIAAIATTTALLLVGGVKTWATRGNCWNAAIENLTVAGLGGLFAYYVGKVFDNIVH